MIINSPSFCSHLVLLEKVARLFISLSPLNSWWETLCPMWALSERVFMLMISLKDACFQIPIHRDSQKYLCFICYETVYQLKTLCFWLLTPPHGLKLVLVWALSEVQLHGDWDCPLLFLWLGDYDKLGKVQSVTQIVDKVPGHVVRVLLTDSNQQTQGKISAVPALVCLTGISTFICFIGVWSKTDYASSVFQHSPFIWINKSGLPHVVVTWQVGVPWNSSSLEMLLYSASKEGWGTHLNSLFVSGVGAWGFPPKHQRGTGSFSLCRLVRQVYKWAVSHAVDLSTR